MKRFMALIFAFAVSGAGAQEPSPMSLDTLLDEARANNPAILAARKKWESTEALVIPAGSWKDPRIGVQRETFAGERSTHYFIEQEMPFPGKLSTESRMRFHEARIAREEYRAKESEVLSEVKIHYHKLLWLGRTAAALRKDAEILRGIARVAQSQIAAGRGGAEEALIAQSQLKAVENAVFEREQQRLIEEEDLNALIGAPPGTRRQLASSGELRELPRSLEELVSRAKENSPMYLATLHMIHHARLNTSRGRYGFAPDFRFFYDLENLQGRTRERFVGLSLSLPLWFWRQSGELKAAREHTSEALAESDGVQKEVFKELYKEYTEVRMHRTLALSYSSEILPLAEAALKIAQKNYETGRTDFAKLSEAVRTLLEAQMKYYEEAYRYGEHWANIERIVGGDIVAGDKK